MRVSVCLWWWWSSKTFRLFIHEISMYPNTANNANCLRNWKLQPLDFVGWTVESCGSACCAFTEHIKFEIQSSYNSISIYVCARCSCECWECVRQKKISAKQSERERSRKKGVSVDELFQISCCTCRFAYTHSREDVICLIVWRGLAKNGFSNFMIRTKDRHRNSARWGFFYSFDYFVDGASQRLTLWAYSWEPSLFLVFFYHFFYFSTISLDFLSFLLLFYHYFFSFSISSSLLLISIASSFLLFSTTKLLFALVDQNCFKKILQFAKQLASRHLMRKRRSLCMKTQLKSIFNVDCLSSWHSDCKTNKIPLPTEIPFFTHLVQLRWFTALR